MVSNSASIVIAGAGSIGCYAGACLALAGRKVTLLARSRVVSAIEDGGLQVSDLDGLDRLLPAGSLTVTDDPKAALAGADVVLVTVKSGATEEMAGLIAAHAPEQAVVVSLQNGVDNVDRLRLALGGRIVLAGMVPFNVIQSGESERPLRVHRATSGTVLIEPGAEGLAELLNVEGFAIAEHGDIKAVQWGKLLFNLGNALVALSDLPLATMLSDRRWRRLLAAQMAEGLATMRAAGIEPGRVTGPPPALIPTLLRLPNWLFLRLARRMLAVDPSARSSMWEDLARGRPTEIEYLQGKVLALARNTGTPAPVNARVAALIHDAEAKKAGPPGLSPEAVSGG
ncbi:2-dehydropantoate 2-reductase [Mesorhizobium sp. YR577]|uniref:2-dehydropantoate 2-reductase n=1 Tax=Mesorhizobium sp. YR577 TaxID=1884373 RepID=UPI0008EADFD8|nr:2-dehydropantoate 2-reductase [Mesorhizobium sp. YR577]SFU18338.1 ketopantoate reductase [Mesorhizobium sp. YR577]